MRKRITDLRDEKPLLDIAAFARKGRLPTPAELLHISLTVHRAPEVMVKVSGGARTLSGVERHMAYIGRDGELGLDVDTDGHMGGKGFERDLVRAWDLDVDALQNQMRNSGATRKPPKLVHNIIFSMPPGTSSRAVLGAVQRLAMSEWALQHRYAMALHTDDDHPHVHVVLKAMSEQGVRLNIRKATLRSWRSQFAENLREIGVNANATARSVRGQTKLTKLDGIFRAHQRGQSTHMSRWNGHVVEKVTAGQVPQDLSGQKLRSTQEMVRAGWLLLSKFFDADGQYDLAAQIRRFEGEMPPPMTEAELRAGDGVYVTPPRCGPDL